MINDQCYKAVTTGVTAVYSAGRWRDLGTLGEQAMSSTTGLCFPEGNKDFAVAS